MLRVSDNLLAWYRHPTITDCQPADSRPTDNFDKSPTVSEQKANSWLTDSQQLAKWPTVFAEAGLHNYPMHKRAMFVFPVKCHVIILDLDECFQKEFKVISA